MPLVLTQTDRNINNVTEYEYSDKFGELYHFPNKHLNKIRNEKGKYFVYYRGRNDTSSGVQEYFAIAKIGDIFQDPRTLNETHKSRYYWYCTIEDCEEFDRPVYFKNKKNNKYLEKVVHRNHFRIGVRVISDSEFKGILDEAGFDVYSDIYHNTCAITKTKFPDVLEAAHIMSYVNPKSNHVQNGILLRRDVHRLFDQDLITIKQDYTILVSSQLKNTEYDQLQGKKIYLPNDTKYFPSTAVLELKLKSFKK